MREPVYGSSCVGASKRFLKPDEMHQMHSCCHSVSFRLSSDFFLFFCEHLRSRFSNHRPLFVFFFLLRYYFKKASDEFECGAVFEEVWEDATVLPMYEGKVLGKVERMD